MATVQPQFHRTPDPEANSRAHRGMWALRFVAWVFILIGASYVAMSLVAERHDALQRTIDQHDSNMRAVNAR